MQVGKQFLTMEINYFLNCFFTAFRLFNIWKESAISTCVLQFILYLLVKAIGFIFSKFFLIFSPQRTGFAFSFFLCGEKIPSRGHHRSILLLLSAPPL